MTCESYVVTEKKLMKFTLATKQNMAQFFAENGEVIPATILSADPLTVITLKTKERDGYEAVQVATQTQKKERVSKSVLGQTVQPFKIVKEFRNHSNSTDSAFGDLQKGAILNLDIFSVGDIITISGISKGKGFQGVMKRHGFKGGWNQRGQKHSHREPGSIGGGGRAGGRVVKGKRMPGRMGSDRVTQKNIQILDIDVAKGLLLVKGAVPGKRGTVLEIRKI